MVGISFNTYTPALPSFVARQPYKAPPTISTSTTTSLRFGGLDLGNRLGDWLYGPRLQPIEPKPDYVFLNEPTQMEARQVLKRQQLTLDDVTRLKTTLTGLGLGKTQPNQPPYHEQGLLGLFNYAVMALHANRLSRLPKSLQPEHKTLTKLQAVLTELYTRNPLRVQVKKHNSNSADVAEFTMAHDDLWGETPRLVLGKHTVQAQREANERFLEDHGLDEDGEEWQREAALANKPHPADLAPRTIFDGSLDKNHISLLMNTDNSLQITNNSGDHALTITTTDGRTHEIGPQQVMLEHPRRKTTAEKSPVFKLDHPSLKAWSGNTGGVIRLKDNLDLIALSIQPNLGTDSSAEWVVRAYPVRAEASGFDRPKQKRHH